jgi:hypothetical protein
VLALYRTLRFLKGALSGVCRCLSVPLFLLVPERVQRMQAGTLFVRECSSLRERRRRSGKRPARKSAHRGREDRRSGWPRTSPALQRRSGRGMRWLLPGARRVPSPGSAPGLYWRRGEQPDAHARDLRFLAARARPAAGQRIPLKKQALGALNAFSNRIAYSRREHCHRASRLWLDRHNFVCSASKSITVSFAGSQSNSNTHPDTYTQSCC